MKVSEDTSFWIMHEIIRRGHEVFHFESRDMSWENGSTRARVRRTRTDVKKGFLPSPPSVKPIDLAETDCVFIRKEPPFDAEYLYALQLLESVKHRTFVLNDPSGIAMSNEKLFLLEFAEWAPETFVTSDPAEARRFIGSLGGAAIVKALDNKSGHGVYRTAAKDSNLPSLLETATDNGRRTVMVQRFIDAWKHGDKRILLLDGEPLGSFLRVPAKADFRANLSVGAKLKKSSLTSRERKITETLAPRLRERGLYFTGIDVIGGFLTEINVTSPAGLADILTLERRHAEGAVVDFIQRRVRA